jgi:hypothetical protein
VLEVWGQHNSFVTGFPRELNSEVPGIKGHEREIEVLGGEVLGGKRIEAVDCVAESPCIAYMLPG